MNFEMSGLIQMTVHTVTQPWARGLIVLGLIMAALCALLAICAGLSKEKEQWTRAMVLFAAIALAGVVMAIVGAKQPRRRILYCCASGPVSLEAVAVKYDIIEVDGKLLKLAER